MSRLVLALSILVVVLAACGPSASQPSPTPSPPSVSPSPSPSAAPMPGPTARPTLSAPPPILTPNPTESPAPVQFTVDEQYLLNGISRGAFDCVPVRDELPIHAVGGIECRSDDPAVARIGFFLFDGDADMLEAYFARMDAEGVARDSGGCDDGEGESAYIPGEDVLPDRHGCFVNAEGYANYRATISGNHIYIGVLGRTAEMRALVDFAWRGNQDVPGNPTLWGQPID
jgi:hypothetical protein